MVMVTLWTGYSFPALAEAIEASPQHIVSTFTGADEVLWELLHKHEKHRILALSPFAKIKDYSNIRNLQAHRLSSHLSTNPELLVGKKADLVVMAAFNRPELRLTYGRLGIPCLQLNRFNSLNDIRSMITDIAQAIGKQSEGEALIRDMDELIKATPKLQKEVKAINYHPHRISMGKKTIFNDVLHQLNIGNVAADLGIEGWQQISAEQLITHQPDVIVVSVNEHTRDQTMKQLRSDSIWKHLNAVKNERLIFVGQAQLNAVSHHVVKAMQKISKQTQKLFPDRFQKQKESASRD